MAYRRGVVDCVVRGTTRAPYPGAIRAPNSAIAFVDEAVDLDRAAPVQ
jgi:hypothetical protein